MSWTYKTHKIGDITQFPENTFGFVYIVTHKPTGKSYIGKKVLFHNKKKKIGKRELEKLQGVVGRRPAYRLEIKESDWKNYYGSNKKIQFLVEEKGFKAFHREILRLCRSKGECSYWETKLQFDNNVLFRDDYYNEIIHCRINAKHLSKETSWQ